MAVDDVGNESDLSKSNMVIVPREDKDNSLTIAAVVVSAFILIAILVGISYYVYKRKLK